jgi:serine protease inhibitor
MPLSGHLAAPTIEFGLRLLGQLEAGAVISPVSLRTALATVREGAAGAAREALDDVLGPEPSADVRISDPGVRLALAQAAWVDDEYRLAPAFAERAAALGVDCRSLRFDDPGAPGEVNAWAAEKTEGMIDHVLDGFDEGERFALANAAYFEGSWSGRFDRAQTATRPFTRSDGSTVEVAMMRKSGWLEYGEDEHVQAIRLPYGREHDVGFVAVIAREGLEPPQFDASSWDALRSRMRSRDGAVSLPRLRLTSRHELTDALKALGLGPAFEPGHDFDGMFEGAGEKSLSRVLQHARVDLDEEGTRAAAFTAVMARAASAPLEPPPPFDLHLDRPFLWAIEDRPTGTLLFLGIVNDPEEST